MVTFLSQSDIPEQASKHLLFWSLVFMGILAAAWAIIAYAKRKSEDLTQGHAQAAMPFSLHDLRQLHASGQLSDEEFNKAREKIVAMSKAALARDAAKKAGIADPRLRKPDKIAEPTGPGEMETPPDPPVQGDFVPPNE